MNDQNIIYLDNAATTFPKPEIVYTAVDSFFRYSANPGRGSHSLAMHTASTIFNTRLLLAEMLGIKQAERLVFTPGCTHSINMALKGFPLKKGDAVLVSALEHNAVMRPLRQLEQSKGIEIVTLPYARKGVIDLHFFIQQMLSRHPRLVVVSEGSNVTGEIVDVRAVAAICGAHKVPLMIDAAQTAGRLPHNMKDLGVSIFCASGHKGLFGPPGAGLLYVAENIELEPILAGGTGSKSEEFDMPSFFPDRLEVGTMPTNAIAGMGAGARWLLETGIDVVHEREQALTRRFLDWALNSGGIRVAGCREGSAGTSTVAFELLGVPCDQVADILDREFRICVRAGLHCAAAAHQALGTIDTGLVRVSFSYFNTEQDVDALCYALLKIAERRDAGQLQVEEVS